jgi:hypothetical protein
MGAKQDQHDGDGQGAVTRPSLPPLPPDIAWIHHLAGEWQSRWDRLQAPQILQGAALLK